MTDEELNNWIKFKSLIISELNFSVNKQNFIGLTIDPSFDTYETLSVSKKNDKFEWTYAAWDSIADYRKYSEYKEERIKLRFGKFIPTILNFEGEIDTNFYFETEKILENLNLKPFVKVDSIGLDGTQYQIAIGDYYSQSTFSWWENLPDEWNELEFIFKRLFENIQVARNR